MDKIRTILVIMLFFGAALAGCTGEEIEQVVEDNTNDTTNSTAEVESGAMFVYIQSAEYAFGIAEQFPLTLHFGAPPMSDNSPYELEMICSVDDGHASDVYATWVKSSGGNAGDFNDITSWSVKNNNSLELDHFAYNPMSDIIDFKNPMVVFEDNLSWDGHIAAEVFDQELYDCASTVVDTTPTAYTSDQILALMGVDGSEGAVLDFDSVGLNEPKFGVIMEMIGPGDSFGFDEEETGMPIDGDVTIAITNMYDDDAQLLHSGMSLTYGVNFGGSIIPLTMQMSDSQGPHSEIEGAGIINQVMTNEDTMQPQATWMIDYIWDYNTAKIQMGMAEEPCNGNGYVMDAMGDMGPHCMCDDTFDWDDGDMMTCVSSDDGGDDDTGPSWWCSSEVGGETDMEIEFELVNDGKEDCGDGSDEPQDMDPSTDSDGDGDLTNDVDNWYTCINGDSIPMNLVNDGNNDCSYAEDEGGMNMEPICYDGAGNEVDCDDMMDDILPTIPEPTAAELLGANWTDSLDEVTGIQSFTGVANMEAVGEEMTITLAIMPTVPPKVTGLTMTNGTVTYTMSFLYGDDVVIDIVDSDTDEWNKGASDFMLNYNEMVFHEEFCTNTESDEAVMKLRYGGYDECTSFNWKIEEWYDEEGNLQGKEACWNDHTEVWYDYSPHYLNSVECGAFEGTIVHNTMIDFELWGQIEVPDSQLEVHILTPAYDEDGNEIEQTVLANFTVANQPWDTEDVPAIGTWTNDDGAEWTIYWRCDDSENHPSIVQNECMIQMTTSDMVEMTDDADGETYMSGPSTNFDVKLYDTWAEDYTGNAMPSFTLGLSLIALLGACLSRRKIE